MDRHTAGFGERLRQFRVRAGLSQAALAERANLSSAAVTTLERGVRSLPYPRTVAALADALGLSAAEQADLMAAARPAASVRPAPPDVPDGTALSAPRLPVWLTTFVGREAELEAVRARLDPCTSQVRLLTLMGPGGVGKTRLAVAAAAALAPAYRDGVTFVDLAPLLDTRLVAPAIGRALDLREGGGRGARALLLEHLRTRRLLLVLDNFEHLTAAGPLVAELLESCPALAVLVTSRTALRVRGEYRFAVGPLAVPPAPPPGVVTEIADTQATAAFPAVQLFVARARAAADEFVLSDRNAAAVGNICRRLEGIPLAIELAAARATLFSAEALLGRLERRLGSQASDAHTSDPGRTSMLAVLTGGAPDLPERQQTLRATLTWSYDLLSPAAQVLFRRLAVFVGGWTLEAAEAVCADAALPADEVLDSLQEMVDHSLVRRLVDADSEPRFGMLEIVREYAREQLALSGELDRLRSSHAEFYSQLGTAWSSGGHTSWTSLWAQSPELIHQALDLLQPELDNLNAALDRWSTSGQSADGLRLAVTLNSLWSRLGQYAIGRRWLEAMLDLADRTAPPSTLRAERAVALTEAGTLASHQGHNEQARALHRRSVELWRELDDVANLSTALASLGLAEWVAGDATQATALLEEALERSRTANLPHTVAISLRDLGLIARSEGEYARAEALFEQAAVQPLPAGWYRGYSLARSLSCLGRVAYFQHDLARARSLFRQAFEVIRQARVTGQALADCLDWQAALEAQQGDGIRAARLLGAADTHWRTSGAHRYGPDEAAYARDLAAVQAALDEQAFAAGWAEGAAMHPEQASAYALEEPDGATLLRV